MKQGLIIVSTLIFSFLSGPKAQAYVLPPKYVYQQWLKRTQSIQGLSYTKVYQQIGEGQAVGPPIKVEEVWIKRPGMIRVWDAKNQIDKRANAQEVFITQQGQKKPSGLSVFDPLELAWMDKDAEGLTFRTQRIYGIVQGQVQWFLHDRRKHWMHGDPQQRFVLFSVDPFAPVMGRKKNLTYEYKYENQNVKKPLLPNRVIVLEGNEPKFQILIQNLVRNPKISSSTFASTP